MKGQTTSGSKDLPLSLHIFQEYSVGDALLQCTKLTDGIEKILEPLQNEPEEFHRLVFLLRNTAIHIPSMKISYYRRRSGGRVALKNITAGLKKTPNHHGCTYMLVKFAIAFSSAVSSSSRNSIVLDLVSSELADLMGGSTDVNRFVMGYVEKSKSLGLSQRITAANCVTLIGGENCYFILHAISV